VLHLDVPEDILLKHIKEMYGTETKGTEGILKYLEERKRDLGPVVEYYTERHKLQVISSDGPTEGTLHKP
jgi:adenylate kinase family enzyme